MSVGNDRDPSEPSIPPGDHALGPRERAYQPGGTTMTHYHEEPDRDETVIVEDQGSAVGTILGVVVILGLLIAIWWFALGPGSSNQGTDVNVDVNLPTPGEVLPTEAPAS